MQVVAEWFASVWSWLTEWVSILGYLAAIVLAVAALIVTSAVKAVTAETVRRAFNVSANQAKLKATGVFPDTKGTQIKIENTGSKEVIIQHIEMCRVKNRGISLFGRKREYKSCKVVLSNKELAALGMLPKFELYDQIAYAFIAPVEYDSSYVLRGGESCKRCVPFYEETHCDDLADLASNKKEAKSVEFVIATDNGKFLVKSGKELKKSVVSKIVSAIARKNQTRPIGSKNDENSLS